MSHTEVETSKGSLTAEEQTEINHLQKLALHVCSYLAITMLGTFLAGVTMLSRSGELMRIGAEALIGACGSAAAAFTSCLDRYANGFELQSGK